MASINTNAAAMTALQTLKTTNKALDTTQGRISTGLRVANASDNAAYWSIATTMRSDNSSMSTVRDALGLGAAQVDIAYTAMDAVKDTLNTIKTKLVAASQPDVDKAKIQEEIKQLQNDLSTYAKSASFSGGNWLNVEGSSIEKVVASFVRGADGAISLGTIDVDTSKTALFNSGSSNGLLQGTGAYSVGGLEVGASTAATWDTAGNAAGDDASVSLGNLTDGFTLAEGDALTFDVSYNGTTHKIVVTAADPDAGLEATDLQAALDGAFGADYFTAGIDATTGAVTISRTAEDATENGKSIQVTNLRATSENGLDVLGMDITDLSQGDLTSLINAVDKALGSVTTAASDLGAIKTRIDSQQTFVGKLMDAVDRGVGQLVDADMSEESTRLQALQVQQQLGIQALSIANGNAQSILSLFR
ncbi:flagellin [Aquamicrobium sp. LC103]|uniref:flagellin N-terminal helical domain-containing protein n=1 Tax=Aquamicrobium sp. LC103 TaxID=1120658 RepID=UPI00063EA360|nr:flagellin [Aquamicrobium sp. LC103]TKT77489.1 flagellin [Aquamicrobium sp. LC103]